ncbi:MAG: PhoX family protein [Candidatus Nitrosocaldus sp.]|nr:PhoX family protein [Candidatus Nitrosocaldus sp.]
MQSKNIYMIGVLAILISPLFYMGHAHASIDSIPASAVCIPPTEGSAQPWKVPPGWKVALVAEEDPEGLYFEDLPDMNVQNPVEIEMPHVLRARGVVDEVAERGRLFYQAHEIWEGGSSVSVIDLKTGLIAKMVEADHLEAVDPVIWTPWNTIIFAEEMIAQNIRDPTLPDVVGGLAYEMNPVTGEYWPLPQLGAKAHEGFVIDEEMNIYGVDENRRGGIYKFVPEVDPRTVGRVPDGKLYALKVVDDDAAPGPRTGRAVWVELDQTQARIDANVALLAAGATVYNRPEDMEMIGGKIYVALTDVRAPGPVDNRVIAIDISQDDPFVTEFVVPGVNVPVEVDNVGDKTDEVTGFKNPDNLASRGEELWIVEDNGPSDIWVALPDEDGDGYSDHVYLFASMEDCEAEGTGIRWGIEGFSNMLFVTQMHAGPTIDGREVGPDRVFVIFRAGLAAMDEDDGDDVINIGESIGIRFDSDALTSITALTVTTPDGDTCYYTDTLPARVPEGGFTATYPDEFAYGDGTTCDTSRAGTYMVMLTTEVGDPVITTFETSWSVVPEAVIGVIGTIGAAVGTLLAYRRAAYR